jgi:hypothetical protein
MSATGRAEENCECDTSERKEKQQHEQKEGRKELMVNKCSNEGRINGEKE